MPIEQEIKQQACEGLLHFQSKKGLARELGISVGAVRDWSIYIRHGFFDWIHEPYVAQRKELLYEAVECWFDQYPIGYTDVAVKFGIRPGTLFSAIRRAVAKLPEQLRPKRIHFRWLSRKSVLRFFATRKLFVPPSFKYVIPAPKMPALLPINWLS